MLRRLLAVVVLALAAAPVAGARLADPPTSAQLRAALVAAGVSPALTAAVAVDLDTGEQLLATRPLRPLRPASTQKLIVAFTVLHALGPGFRTETVVLGEGEQRGSTWAGDLVLEGHGDPSLHGDDLGKLVSQLRARGIVKVTGRVVGDESFFDRRRTAPGWKPSYYINESAPLSALIVDRGWLDGRTRREPALAAAKRFQRMLEEAGIDVAHAPGRGTAGDGATQLAHVSSPSMRELVAYMNTESDNFVAEMLLKQLGARLGVGGTTAAGAAVAQETLTAAGVPLAGVRIVDGSGLSRSDRLTARALVAILVAARSEPRLSAPFTRSLAVAGKTGTLEDRMRSGPAYGVVRAKTGTTDLASALAGFAGPRYVFAVLMNGNPIATTPARTSQDRFAQLLAGGL